MVLLMIYCSFYSWFLWFVIPFEWFWLLDESEQEDEDEEPGTKAGEKEEDGTKEDEKEESGTKEADEENDTENKE